MSEISIEMNLPLDADGFLRRECPNCERQFKWKPTSSGSDNSENEEVEEYYCPYCYQPALLDAWWTKEQLEYAQQVALKQVLEPGLKNLQRRINRANDSSGLVQIKASMFSPETIRQMAQTYEAWMQDSSMPSRALETMKWAYQQICAGKDPWTGLGSFSHAWYGYAKNQRNALVAEPLAHPEQETEYTHRWAAFCAASVEFLCERYQVLCPDWVSDPRYCLKDPWWYNLPTDTQALRERIRQRTPAAFVRRNIFCGSRLFQNKYELYEWMQEAMAQGITSPDEIRRYAHQREITIHGG